MEMKQNQTFFCGTYLNLVPYLFLSKNIPVLQWISKSKFLSFMTKVNPNNGNETKSEIFPWDIFKSDIIFHWSQNTKLLQSKLLHRLNDFWNLFLQKVHLKNEWYQFLRENIRRLISFLQCLRKLVTFSREKFTTRS